ncbi:hypothetical protein LC092_19375 [Stappia stellulata]|uniref:hypothetical protein n=1 Tax=Stappia stellulata TaxID=71235 RepID=UPI001CD4C012|nr:hypothetical protein [Stappia stellulata]MCA1244612.1 hypothetical protein [Stappia stellulata]
MIPGHRQDGHAACPMAGRGGGVVQRPTLPADACSPACTELYRRLCERLAVPSRTPPRESPEGCETGCETGAALLEIQAQWLERAVAHEKERGRAGSWLHDRHRLVALRQLRAMALCLARGSPHKREAGAAPPNANDRREISRRS